MSTPINQASESTKRTWESQIEWDRMFNPAATGTGGALDAEAQAEVVRSRVESSAIRGLLIGLPLSLALWGLPVAVWLASGNEWLGALACVAEFVLAGWLVWGRRERTHSRAEPGAGPRTAGSSGEQS